MTIYDDLFDNRSISNLKRTNPTTFDDIVTLTDFLDATTKVTHRQRLWHIVNNIWILPQCDICGCSVKWQAKIRNYSKFCSQKCIGLSSSVKRKRKQTCMIKYNVDSFSKTKEFKNKQRTYNTKAANDKRKATCLSRYGNVNYLQSDEGSTKTKETIKRLYGVDNVRKSQQVVHKIKQTIYDRYGVEHYNQTTKYKHKMVELYADPRFKQQCVDNRQKTMLDKFGVLSTHLLKLSDDQLEKLNNVDWLVDQHHTKKRTISNIATELTVDKQTILSKFYTNNIKIFRYQTSMMERELAMFIQSNTDVDILLNDRTVLHPKELDIYIPQYKLALEFNGLFWHSECAKKDKWYHYNKTQGCVDSGIQLIHIFEDDWIQNKPLVKEMILHKMGKSKSKRIYARNCECVEVSTKDKKAFFDAYHIQGNGPSSIQYGLTISGELVCVMGFILKSDGICYLNRYATSGIIVGGFNKVLQHFLKYHTDITQVVSFADREVSNGNLYIKSGFELDSISPPDYKYIVNNRRIHKFNFRKSTLKQIFDDYDGALSETEMMKNHKIPRIWNAGLMRFIYDTKKRKLS